MRVVKVDANTQFLSQLGRGRGMQTMEMNGMKDVDTGVIERHILSYYKEMFGTAGIKWCQLGSHFWSIREKRGIQ